MKARVLIADDHMLVAQGIHKLLESEFEVVRLVSDGRSLIRAVEETSPDLVLVDISLPLLNGLDASRQIRKLCPSAKILMLTMHAEKEFVVNAFQVGVAGYVLKQSVSSELLHAIEEVLKGNKYISPAVAHKVIERLNDGVLGQMENDENKKADGALSLRQREVLQLVAEGRSTKEIALILNVSCKTIEFHRSRIIKELGIKSRPELTKYAIAKGIIALETAGVVSRV